MDSARLSIKRPGGGNRGAARTLVTCAVLAAGLTALGSIWALGPRAETEARVSVGDANSPPPVPTHQDLASETNSSQAATPEVTAVDPPRVSPGGQTSLKITGKNFAEGVKVAFSNPGIRVLETERLKSTALTTRIQIAPDAPTGKSSLFVVNPEGDEVEFPFEVAGSATAAPTAPAAPASGTATPKSHSSAGQRFVVYNLGEVANIIRSPSKTKGALILSKSELAYEEGGQEVFSTRLSEIKEVDINSIAGFNTGTFHVILKSGKTYNFAPASLRPADSQAVVDALRSALPH